jgi:ribosomal protein S18 acetylase RimI-like enzyme
MELNIRTATESDFEGVSAVFLDELSFHADLLPDRFIIVDQTMTRQWFIEIVRNKEKDLILAQINDEVVGVLHIELRKSPELPFIVPRCYAYVSDLAVTRDYRFRGYGRTLMNTAIAWANERRAEAVELNVWELNKDAISFYDRLGFDTLRRRMSFDLRSSD